MLRIAIALALSGIVSIFALPTADACINHIERSKRKMAKEKPDVEVAKRTQQKSDAAWIAAATDDLNAGRNAEVIVAMYAHFGYDVNGWALNPRAASSLEHEVVLLVALAVLRSEGGVERYPRHVAAKPRRQVDNVRWAIRAMEGLAFVGFAADRHLAEAWGRDPELRDAAIEKLQLLNDKGLLISEYQKSLLARLLREQGDDDEANRIQLAVN